MKEKLILELKPVFRHVCHSCKQILASYIKIYHNVSCVFEMQLKFQAQMYF